LKPLLNGCDDVALSDGYIQRMSSVLTLTVLVPGMTCGHCEGAIKSEVGKVTGVTEVQVDLATKHVTVVGSDDLAAITEAIDEAGFEVV
jgi:copper chaperone